MVYFNQAGTCSVGSEDCWVMKLEYQLYPSRLSLDVYIAHTRYNSKTHGVIVKTRHSHTHLYEYMHATLPI
jgi:hypothetical protein